MFSLSAENYKFLHGKSGCEFNSLASRLPRDDKSNLEEIAKQNTFSTKYTYDKFNQLVSAGSSDGKAYSYNFDPIGNRLSDGNSKYAFNNLNQILKSENVKSDVPEKENVFAHDKYGNLTKAFDVEYKYNLHDQLLEVKKDGLLVKYSYDPLGQRIKTEEVTAENTKTTKYLMSNMIEQARYVEDKIQFHTLGLDIKGTLTSAGGVGVVLATSNYELSSNSYELKTSFNFLYDGNGNVIASCNDKGVITAKLAYSPFGEKISGPDLAFEFSTKSADSSGLVYYGFRFYNPKLGRWMSRDPIGEQGGYNLSLFCYNNPLTNIDILGTHCKDCDGIRDDELNKSEEEYTQDFLQCQKKYKSNMDLLNSKIDPQMKKIEQDRNNCYKKAETVCLGSKTCEDSLKWLCDTKADGERAVWECIRRAEIILIDVIYDTCVVTASKSYLNRNESIELEYMLCKASYGFDSKGCPCKK